MPGLWDIAIEQARQNEEGAVGNSTETAIFVTGARTSGKSTIINRYLSKSEVPKSTIALEYVFARHSRGLDSAKDVCHIWELGGGTLFTDLLDVVITPKRILKSSLMIVVDLSKPEDIWNTTETLIKAVRSRIEKVLSTAEAKDLNFEQMLQSNTKERLGEDQMDKSPLLIPVVIFGSKYDIFQDFDSEKKKIVCRGLRFLALTHGAALYWTSNKSESLLGRMKGVFSHLAFDLQSSKTFAVDHNKPICIPFGTDSVHKIGMSTADDGKDFVKSYDMWKNTFDSTFPPQTRAAMPEDPAMDRNFAERDVDLMRQQKDKELEEYLKSKDKKNRWEGIIE